MEFATVLAWIFGVLSTVLFVLRTVGGFTYVSSGLELLDNINGIERKFPIFWPATIAIVCWTWLLTH